MGKTLGKRNIITDGLVVELTGENLEHWFNWLDQQGAQKLSHAEIFALLSLHQPLQSLGQWNQNLLTTTYEWERGLKQRGQRENGFEISVSKTVNVPISSLYRAFINEEHRKRWLKENIHIRKTTENKSARVTWSDNETSLSIDFYTKGETKAQIVVQHHKISQFALAEGLKKFWAEKLESLKSLLES